MVMLMNYPQLNILIDFLLIIEIRTPLSGVMGTIGLLTATNLTYEQQELAHIAQVCGEQLLVVINDILDLR